MSCRKVLSVNEIISHLEDETDVLSADTYITPPENYRKSDGDSGDEESTHINSLSRHQLLAEAELRATVASETGIDVEDSILDAPAIEPMPIQQNHHRGKKMHFGIQTLEGYRYTE
ncbi:hypothetical protein EVAR_87082_1 [Eumeta japonica]|uniref:Uncharacterized protein n=1 Tax=Eumeta variegata TaxID=151549 RepID=A0A4C1VRL4_EUMVA|nr:hypothetical protein EVAR_87082_1 [Eumeta japonica]